MDRDGWVAASDLQPYEKVKTTQGYTVLDTLWIDFNHAAVFNLETWKTHNYVVENEVVHNGCSDDELRQTFVEAFLQSKLLKSVKKYIIDEVWDVSLATWRGNFFEDILAATVYKNWKQTSKWFKYIDYHDAVTGIGKSLKSTELTDANKIVSQWKDNFLDLAENRGKTLKQGSEKYILKEIQIEILIPAENIGKPFIKQTIDKIEALNPLLKGKVSIKSVENLLNL